MQRTEKVFNLIYVLLVFSIFISSYGSQNNAVSGGTQPTTAAAKSSKTNISDATSGALPRQKGSAEVGISVDQFTAELKERGFEAAEGYFHLWSIEDCPQSFKVMGTCYFNNPAAPYVMAVVPYWPDEYIDLATQGAFGATAHGYGTSFRFDPNEAIVIFGYLPPKAAYFGMQSYLFTRKGDYQTNNDTYSFINSIGAADVFFHKVLQNADRIGSFDSLSNSNNNVVIERQSGGSFNQFRYFIITPDRFMDKQVRQVLHKLSVEDKDIFTECIPSNVTIGLDADADDFVSGIRYSMPDDGGGEGTPSDEWRHHPTLTLLRIRDSRPPHSMPDDGGGEGTPSDEWRYHPTLTPQRIRDSRPHRPPQGYPAWEDNSPEPRTAVDERPLKPDLNHLVRKVSETWGQPCALDDCSDRGATSFIDTQSYPFNLVGPLCNNIGMDCLGDAQDASYQFRGGYGFDNGEVYAVVGTLGTATGNATYVSLGVQNFRLRLGAVNVDGTKLMGSADPAWYPGVDNLDKFYVYFFTRQCEGLKDLTHGFCLSVQDTELVIPPGDKASFVQRDYIRVGTQRGPDSKLVLHPMVLKLQRPAQ
jgi:hypothetical protein